MPNIIIYTTDYCPYCVKAKMLLQRKKVEFKEIKISDDQTREEMIKKSGGKRTVPQIFINDFHVGGSDELHNLDRQGKLDELLK
ncbi:MAG: glutaredoxin 3 [Myxococcota bacterium]|jgi:glutaredoxin 3